MHFSPYKRSDNKFLELKSNERLSGMCKELNADSLFFDFKGSTLKIATADIRALYFAPSAVTANSNAGSSQKAKISGVVSYFFNANHGDKADVGSVIYIIDSTRADGLGLEKISKFHYGASYHRMENDYTARKQKVPEDVAAAVVKYGVETEAKYKMLEEEGTNAFIKLTISKEVVTLTADGTGAFSSELSPATYYVVIQSKHRQRMNMMEINGSIEYRTVRLLPGQQKDISYSFPVTEI